MRKVGEPLVFTKEWLILCEGSSDKAFFSHLISKRGLPDFQVTFPYGANEGTGGWTKFGNFLLGAPAVTGFDLVRAIVIATDSDDNPNERFQAIQSEIRKAKGFGVPSNPLEVARSSGTLPVIVVLMILMNGQPGNLETLCLPAAYAKWPELKRPLDEYINQSPAKEWEQRKQDKVRIQCLIAGTCKQDPCTPLSWLWNDRSEEYHIPLEDDSFDEVAGFLENFGELLKG
jgi:Protein of unknown function (DUF3226)